MRARKLADQTRAIGYVRTSTADQTISPAAQAAQIERYAQSMSLDLIAVYFDRGASGGDGIDKRPGLFGALDAIARGAAGTLIVAKRDRLARDVLIAGAAERFAERYGARILAADGTANGDSPESALMRGICDLFAAYERALIRARTRAALAHKQSKGERTGAIPYGYRLADSGQIVPDPTEQRIMTYVCELREHGLSLREIRERLALERVPARGSRWHLTSIARIAQRAAAAAA